MDRRIAKAQPKAKKTSKAKPTTEHGKAATGAAKPPAKDKSRASKATPDGTKPATGTRMARKIKES